MAPTTQAVILARGLGTRMRQAGSGPALTGAQAAVADAGLKSMMPISGSRVAPDRPSVPFLDYILSALADAGIARATIVVGHEHGAVRDYFAATSAGRRVAVEFVEQREPRGTADAVLAARPAVGTTPFLVLNADNYYGPAEIASLARLGTSGLVAFEAHALVTRGGLEPDRVLRFALLDIADDDTLRAIREKPGPDDPLSLRRERWVSMNLWSFTSAIFDACERITVSPRGELELQSAVTYAMQSLGTRFAVLRAHAAVLDLSTRADVERVRAQLASVVPRP